MFDIKNAPREDMKLAFMEAIEFIKGHEQESQRSGVDLAQRAVQRIRENRRDKKQKLNDEID